MSATDAIPCDLCAAPEPEFLLEKDGACYARCPGCGFIYASPRIVDPLDYNEDFFERSLERYVERCYSAPKQKSYAKKLRRFESYRKLGKRGRLLEIGANVGGFLHQASALGWEAKGVELSEACAEHARRERGLDVITGTLETCGLPEASFDLVYSNAVFEHLESPSSVLAAASRLLRPGGAIFFDTVNYDSFTVDFVGAEWKLLDPRVHPSLFSPTTARAFCAKAGLDLVDISTHGVRFRPNHAPRLHGLRRLAEEIRKLPYSIAARLLKRGDSIAVLAERRA